MGSKNKEWHQAKSLLKRLVPFFEVSLNDQLHLVSRYLTVLPLRGFKFLCLGSATRDKSKYLTFFSLAILETHKGET